MYVNYAKCTNSRFQLEYYIMYGTLTAERSTVRVQEGAALSRMDGSELLQCEKLGKAL